MLWRYTQQERERAARAIMYARGFDVRDVHHLTSGLYQTVTLTNGSAVTIPADEVSRVAYYVQIGRRCRWDGLADCRTCPQDSNTCPHRFTDAPEAQRPRVYA